MLRENGFLSIQASALKTQVSAGTKSNGITTFPLQITEAALTNPLDLSSPTSNPLAQILSAVTSICADL